MTSFCPAGYESDSDGDGFTIGDDVSCEKIKSKPINGIKTAVMSEMDGFGVPVAKAAPAPGNVRGRGTQSSLMHSSSHQAQSCVTDELRTGVIRGNVGAVRQLLNDGVDVNTAFSSGWTPLMYAANCAYPDVVALLLSAGADPNSHKDMYTALMAACASNKEDKISVSQCVRKLIDAKADINAYDRYHMSALMYAAREGHVEVVQQLTDSCAVLDKQDCKGYTALMWASFRNHLRVVQILLASGADINKQSIDGSRACDFAFMNGHKRVEELLRSHMSGKQTEAASALSHSEQTSSASGEETTKTTKKTSLVASSAGNTEVVRYGDLELFLAGIGLSDFISVFHHHNVDLQDLLRMNDNDLQEKLKINQATVRKRILEGVRDTHVKHWEVTSLPQLSYNKPLSCAEAVALVANVKKHSAYISSSIGYVSDQIHADREILRDAQEGASCEELRIHTEDAITNTQIMFDELVLLRSRLTKMGKTEDFKPPDLIYTRKKKSSNRRRKLLTLSVVVMTGAATFWFREKLAEILRSRLESLS